MSGAFSFAGHVPQDHHPSDAVIGYASRLSRSGNRAMAKLALECLHNGGGQI